MLPCACSPCENDPVADVQWGSDKLPMQQASICQEHLNQLWEMLNPLLKKGTAWFRIDGVGKIIGTLKARDIPQQIANELE